MSAHSGLESLARGVKEKRRDPLLFRNGSEGGLGYLHLRLQELRAGPGLGVT